MFCIFQRQTWWNCWISFVFRYSNPLNIQKNCIYIYTWTRQIEYSSWKSYRCLDTYLRVKPQKYWRFHIYIEAELSFWSSHSTDRIFPPVSAWFPEKYLNFFRWIIFYLLVPEYNVMVVYTESSLKQVVVMSWHCVTGSDRAGTRQCAPAQGHTMCSWWYIFFWLLHWFQRTHHSLPTMTRNCIQNIAEARVFGRNEAAVDAASGATM